MLTQKPIEFWIAVAIAVIVKFKTSQRLTPLQSLMSILVSLGAAYVATDWVTSLIGTPEVISTSLIALTAESVMRWVLSVVDNPQTAMDWLRAWRGK